MMEHPRDYDLAKIATLEFAPACHLSGCFRDAAEAVQCVSCLDIRALFCVRHAREWNSAARAAECGSCHATSSRYAALYAIRPLGAFLVGGAR